MIFYLTGDRLFTFHLELGENLAGRLLDARQLYRLRMFRMFVKYGVTRGVCEVYAATALYIVGCYKWSNAMHTASKLDQYVMVTV